MEAFKEFSDSMESFDKVLAFITENIKKGEIFILLMPPFDVRLEFPTPSLKERAAKEIGVDQEQFTRNVKQIESLLANLLDEDIESYIKARVKHDVENGHITKDKEEDKKKELRNQAKKVELKLLNERLRNRYRLKALSKAPALAYIDWDVKIKTADSSNKPIKFPYTTCRITFQRDFRWEPHLLLGGRAFESVQLNLTKEEVLYLQKILQVVQSNLNELEKQNEIQQ